MMNAGSPALALKGIWHGSIELTMKVTITMTWRLRETVEMQSIESSRSSLHSPKTAQC